MKNGMFWNKKGYAPTTESTNYCGGPWSRPQPVLGAKSTSPRSKPTHFPPLSPRSIKSSPPSPDGKLRPNTAVESLEVQAEMTGRWPYPPRFPGSPRTSEGQRPETSSPRQSSSRQVSPRNKFVNVQ